MTNQEIQSYQKMGIPIPKKRRKIRSLTVNEWVELGLLFLLNKIFLLGAFSPLGLSFFAAIFPKRKKPLSILVAVLGILFSGMGIFSLKYIGALVLISAFSLLMDKEFSRKTWLYGLSAAVSVAVTGMVYVGFDGFYLYDTMLLLLETTLIFLSYFVFSYACKVLTHLTKRTVFEPMETLSLLALCAGVCLSLGSTTYFGGLSHVLSVFVIFVAALSGGFTLSAGAGILFGLVNSLTDVLPAQVVAVYSINAICAGLLQKKGRWGILLGFFFSNSLAAMYFSGSVNQIIAFYHILAAGLLLFLVPDDVLSIFGELIKTPGYQEDSIRRLREIIQNKLTELSRSFSELSEIFHKAIENRVDMEMRDPSYLFDRTADAVCRNCSLMNFCWQKEYGETRHALIGLYHRMEQRGRAERDDVPESFQRECIRLDDFLEALNKNYEVHKINLLWAGRVTESRNLVAEQFRNVSSVLGHLQFELGSEITDGVRMERKIAAALDREGIEASAIRVMGAEAVEVTMNLAPEQESASVTGVLDKLVGVPMQRVPFAYGETCGQVKFRERPRYTMEAGFAKVAGSHSGHSGDYHLFSVTGDGKFVLALSDGMGQGGEAEEKSSMTIHLIRKLLSAGFDKETALRLINSMLMVSSHRESFATADLCLVNLYSGALEFIKIGAANSYLKSGQSVDKISSTSLPVGILCDVEADCELKYAKEGDWVVMVTDGITDVLERGFESPLQKLIAGYCGDSPQGLADEILRRAMRETGNCPKDDMTVLVARMQAS